MNGVELCPVASPAPIARHLRRHHVPRDRVRIRRKRRIRRFPHPMFRGSVGNVPPPPVFSKTPSDKKKEPIVQNLPRHRIDRINSLQIPPVLQPRRPEPPIPRIRRHPIRLPDRKPPPIIIAIHQHRRRNPPHIRRTLHRHRIIPAFPSDGKRIAINKRNDRHHHQQLNQRKPKTHPIPAIDMKTPHHESPQITPHAPQSQAQMAPQHKPLPDHKKKSHPPPSAFLVEKACFAGKLFRTEIQNPICGHLCSFVDNLRLPSALSRATRL